MKKLKLRETRINGENIEYIQSRSVGKDVVFLHGLNGDCYFWRKVINKMDSRFRCWSISLPKWNESKIDEDTNIVIGFIKKMRITKPLFVGYSLGGLILFNMSIKGVEGEKTIFVSTPVIIKPPLFSKLVINVERYIIKKSALARKAFTWLFTFNQGFRKAFKLVPIEIWFDGYADLISNKLPFDVRSIEMKNITIFVYGEKDIMLKACGGFKHYNILDPESIIAIKSCSHFIPTTHPKKLSKIINNFFINDKL